MISATVPSAKYSCSGSRLMFVKGRTAIDGLSGRASAGAPAIRAGYGTRSTGCGYHAISPNGPGNVLEVLLTHIGEGQVEPAGGIFLNAGRDANAAGLGQRFQPGGHIDAVAQDVAIFDDNIAHIDADTEFDSFRDAASGIARGQQLLHLAGAAQGVNHTGELHEQSVARSLDQPAPMRRDLRVDHLRADGPYSVEGSLFVSPDQARISRDVGCQDGRQPTLSAIRVHSQKITSTAARVSMKHH